MKKIIASLVGQSNERGRRKSSYVADTGAETNSFYGCPCTDPISPNGIDDSPGNGNWGSWWPRAAEKWWVNQNVWIRIRNTAVGATSIVEHWCGDPSGVGTGVPYSSADGGFDPNSYLADALAELSPSGYDEKWVFISIGQRDAANNASLANFQLGLENTVNYFLDNGIKVALGFTCYQPGNATWFANNGDPGWAAALATFSGNANVIAGANLYRTLNTNVGLYDGSHMTESSYDQAGDAWAAISLT